MISVVEIDASDHRQREEFMLFPYRLSGLFPNWVPGLRLVSRQLLNPALNPYLTEVPGHFFMAKGQGKTVGRIALFGPGHWHNEPQMATIGFLDFIDSDAVFSALILQAKKKARELGATRILGPLNPNIHYDIGVLTRGFDLPNAALMNYNPPYYASAFARFGWSVAQVFESWQLTKETYRPSPAFKKIAQRALANPSLKLRHIRIKEFDAELRTFYELYCGSFAGHWGFTPPSFKEFRFIANDLRYLLKTEMGMIAEFNGQPAGFVLGIPDFYKHLQKDRSGRLFPFNLLRLITGIRTAKTMRVMIAGVLPGYRDKGIHAAMFSAFTSHLFMNCGIESGEIGWVMKGNSSMEKTLGCLGAVPVKEYVIFGKALDK